MMMQEPVKSNIADCGTQTTSSDPKNTLGASTLNVSAATLNQKLNDSKQMTERQRDKNVYFPSLHKAHKGRKIIDWHFRSNRPIWCLGDLNLNICQHIVLERLRSTATGSIILSLPPDLGENPYTSTSKAGGAVGGH